MKRARAFVEAQLDGTKPTAAAGAVAVAWQVAETTVFKDHSRHALRLLYDAERKTRAINIELGRTLLSDHPEIAALFVREFKSALEELGAKLDRDGDSAGASAALTYNPTIDDDWLEFLGEQYRSIWRNLREKTGG